MNSAALWLSSIGRWRGLSAVRRWQSPQNWAECVQCPIFFGALRNRAQCQRLENAEGFTFPRNASAGQWEG